MQAAVLYRVSGDTRPVVSRPRRVNGRRASPEVAEKYILFLNGSPRAGGAASRQGNVTSRAQLDIQSLHTVYSPLRLRINPLGRVRGGAN